MPSTNTRGKAEAALGKFVRDTHGFKLKADVAERFFLLCELADILDDEFGSENIRIDVDPSTFQGAVCVDTDDIVLEYGRSHPFFKYIKAADFLHFSKSKSGGLSIYFGVKDLWVTQ